MQNMQCGILLKVQGERLLTEENVELNNIFYTIKPELKDKDNLSGMKIIDDMGFDSVEVVMLMAELEEYVGIPIEDVNDILEVIDDYDSILKWTREVR